MDNFLKEALEAEKKRTKRRFFIRILIIIVVLAPAIIVPAANMNELSNQSTSEQAQGSTGAANTASISGVSNQINTNDEPDAANLNSAADVPLSQSSVIEESIKVEELKRHRDWLTEAYSISLDTSKIFELLDYRGDLSQQIKADNYSKASVIDSEATNSLTSLRIILSNPSTNNDRLKLQATDTAQKLVFKASELLWSTSSERTDSGQWTKSSEYDSLKRDFTQTLIQYTGELNMIEAGADN